MRSEYARSNIRKIILLALGENGHNMTTAQLRALISPNLDIEIKELLNAGTLTDLGSEEPERTLAITEKGLKELYFLTAWENQLIVAIEEPAVILWYHLKQSHDYTDALNDLMGAQLNEANAGRIIAEQQTAIDTQAETIARQALDLRTLKRQAGELEREQAKVIAMLEGIAEIANTAPRVDSTNTQKEGMFKLIAQSLYNVLNFAKRQEIPF